MVCIAPVVLCLVVNRVALQRNLDIAGPMVMLSPGPSNNMTFGHVVVMFILDEG